MLSRFPEVFCVGSVDHTYNRVDSSAIGPELGGLAPGYLIWAADVNDPAGKGTSEGFDIYNGTSCKHGTLPL